MTRRAGACAALAMLALAGLSHGARADLSDKLNPFGSYYNNVARAAETNDAVQVRRLLSSGNNVNEVEADNQRSALQWAAINGNLQIAAILIKASARLEDRDLLGNTALIYAADHDRLEMVKLLLDVGAQIDGQNKDGMTALMLAAKNGEVEIVRVLLARGADPNKSDYTGRDAQGWALESHRTTVVTMIKDAGTKKR